METLLPSELVKSANPGIDDFGSGNVLALNSQCLRTTKLPTSCSICLEACPVGALVADENTRPHATTDCLRCGLCISTCPSHALAATTRTIQQIGRLLLQATLRVDELTIACERSMALFRLDATSDEPRPAEEALRTLNKACETENLFRVPCLAMLPREVWFLPLNEIGVARIQALYVYLPPGQCEACPANLTNQVAGLLSSAIDSAERWSGQTVTPVYEVDEIPQYHRPTIRNYVTVSQEVGRREAFTGFFTGFKQVVDETNRVGNRAADEILKQRERKDTLNRTLLAAELAAHNSGPHRPIISPLRYMLVESVGRNPANAEQVEFFISQTDDARCTHCGNCIDACSIRARSWVENDADDDAEEQKGEPATAVAVTKSTKATTKSMKIKRPTDLPEIGFQRAINSAGLVIPATQTKPQSSAAAKPAATPTSPTTPAAPATPTTPAATGTMVASWVAGATQSNNSTAATATAAAPDTSEMSTDNQHIQVNPLYCLGCSACIQVCPEQACSFTLATGLDFLRPDWDEEPEPEDEDDTDSEA